MKNEDTEAMSIKYFFIIISKYVTQSKGKINESLWKKVSFC